MVLEQLLKLQTIERRSINVFLLAMVYTFLGIVCARLIFPAHTGLMGVAFTSLLLIPSLGFVLQQEENVEIREKKLSLRLLFKDHKDIFRLYLLLFLGILVAYGLTALFWPSSAITHYFSAQTDAVGITGAATSPASYLLVNNLLVLFVCFILSLIYGAGAVLFITWNASAWGVFLGFFARAAADQGLFFSLECTLPIVPHMVTEAAAYIGAAIVGGVVSKAVLREKLGSHKFHHIITDAVMLLAIAVLLVIIAGWIEASIAPRIVTSIGC